MKSENDTMNGLKSNMPNLIFKKIKSISKKGTKKVYDIQVAKNHNFFANDLLVHNCIIFQEQVMELAEKCAGFPKDQCDEVRRAIMKRSISGGAEAKQKANDIRDSFVEGCVKNDYTVAAANDLYDKLLYFCGYGFNKSLYFSQPVNIYNSKGEFISSKQLQDVNSGDFVKSRDENTNEDIYVLVSSKHDHGVLELVEVELTTGEKVKCTWDHKFRTVETREMLPLREIVKKNLSIVVDSAIETLT